MRPAAARCVVVTSKGAQEAEVRYDRAECHYGQPVLVVGGVAYGPGDLGEHVVKEAEDEHARALHGAGYTVLPGWSASTELRALRDRAVRRAKEGSKLTGWEGPAGPFLSANVGEIDRLYALADGGDSAALDKLRTLAEVAS